MPTTSDPNEPFVSRVEMAIMQCIMLAKAKESEVTRENLQQTFRGNMQMSTDHFNHCLTQLVSDGHLQEIGGNKYKITDDGREDIQKLQPMLVELPSMVGMTGASRPGMSQQQPAGGNVGGRPGMGTQPGGTQGGTYGSNPGGNRPQNR